MKAAIARFYYRHLQSVADMLDRMNADNDPMYTAGNEGIRRIAQEMSAYTEDKTATQEMPVAEWSEAS